MYGKWVTIILGEGFISPEVFVYCTPETSEEELQVMARDLLKEEIDLTA